MRIFYALNQLTKNTIYANLNIEKLSNSVGGWIYLGKEKNITSGEIEGMYEYISDIILKNSKVINKKEIKVKRRNNDDQSEENRREER